jgi:hypothetical protein
MTLIFKEKLKVCLLEQIFSYANLLNVQAQLKLFCLNLIAYVCMETRYGVHTVLVNLPNSYRVIITYKCAKLFFGYDRRYSVTQMLLELGLPCFKTVLYNGRLLLRNARLSSVNFIINHLCSLGIG